MLIFRAAQGVESKPVLAWSLAALLFMVALGLRFWVDPFLPAGFPYLTFFPAVILATFLCGLWPGIACAFASLMAAWYWFIGPVRGFQITEPTVIALLFFVLIVVVDIILIHAMKSSVAKLTAARQTANDLYDRQRVMFQELQHRVANNIQFISSLLNLQKRQIQADPAEATNVIDEARARLDTISRIHRRLYDPDTVTLPVATYLEGLCRDIISAAGRPDVRCEVRVDPRITLELPKLMNLSLLTMEVVTNSLKHAFNGRQGGLIRMELEPSGEDAYRLVIADDGPGMATGAKASSGSLGQRIIQGLAGQLGGVMAFSNENGTVARLDFPA